MTNKGWRKQARNTVDFVLDPDAIDAIETAESTLSALSAEQRHTPYDLRTALLMTKRLPNGYIPGTILDSLIGLLDKVIAADERSNLPKRKKLTRHLAVHTAVTAGHSWESAYAWASEQLATTPAAGSAETMRKDYQTVRKELAGGRGNKYYSLRPILECTAIDLNSGERVFSGVVDAQELLFLCGNKIADVRVLEKKERGRKR